MRVFPAALPALLIAAMFLPACGDDTAEVTKSPVLIVDLDAVAKGLGRWDQMLAMIRKADANLDGQGNRFANSFQKSITESKEKVDAAKKKYDASKKADDKKAWEELNKKHGQLVVGIRNQLNVAGQKLGVAKRNYKANVFAKFREEVKPHVEKIARDRGASAVFYSRLGNGMLTMWTDPTIDITDDVSKSIRQAKALPPVPGAGSIPTQLPPAPKPAPTPSKSK
jgi:Skp family chaperone for outer membrane proteins